MAQKEGRLRMRARMLARRYGLKGAKGVALACVVLVVTVGAIGAFRLTSTEHVTVERGQSQAASSESASISESSSKGMAQSEEPEPNGSKTVIHVDGAVAKPGIYVLEGETPRVNDAINAAGGMTEEADTHQINLASPIADGQKIYVARVGEEAPQNSEDASSQAQAASKQTLSDGQGSPNSGAQVNINTASAEELQTLSGIGEATSSAIVKDREENGPFGAIEDLMRVTGIGEKKYEKIRDRICV